MPGDANWFSWLRHLRPSSDRREPERRPGLPAARSAAPILVRFASLCAGWVVARGIEVTVRQGNRAAGHREQNSDLARLRGDCGRRITVCSRLVVAGHARA